MNLLSKSYVEKICKTYLFRIYLLSFHLIFKNATFELKGGILIVRKKEFYCGYLWEKGSRENNEDSIALWHLSKEKKDKILAVVCDGIGGLPKGEEASSYVVRQLANWFMSEGYKMPLNKQQRRIQQLCFQLHEELKRYGKEQQIKLGTTMTCVLIHGKRLVWIHCGDCRFYLFNRKKVRILTKEHQNEKGELLQAIGVGQWQILESKKRRIKNGDRFLICSDGVYRHLQLQDVKKWAGKEICSDEQANRMLRQLGEKKKYMGEKDNISALYFGYGKREGKGKYL